MKLDVHKDAITGKDDFMFLHTGANENLAHIAFEKSYPLDDLKRLIGEWVDARAHARSMGSDYHVLIFPNKETLCWDKHPLSETLPRPQSVGLLIKQLDDDNVVQFWDDGDSEYFLKYDTHFSRTGNLEFAYQIGALIDPDYFATLSKEAFWDRLNGDCKVRTGDLGERFDPPRTEPRWGVVAAQGTMLVSNDVPNRGFIELSKTPDAPIRKRVLVFTDSYFRGMRHYLSPWVSELVVIHTTLYCPDLVDLYRPDFVLQSYVERFMAQPPEKLLSTVPFEEIALQSKKKPSRDMRAVLAALPR